MTAEPMISVKKPDGTTVRVPLSEFKKMHAAPAAASSQASPTSVNSTLATPTFPAEPKIEVESVKPTVLPPVKLDPKNEIVAAHETPLLEEVVTPTEVRSAEIMQAPPAITDEIVRQIVRDSKLMVANDLWGRAQSLIASWLKGVRDNEQFLHYVTAPAAKGGLGLETEVAAGVLMVMGKYKKKDVPLSVTERPATKPALEVPLSAPTSQAFTDSLTEQPPRPLRFNTPVMPKIEPVQSPVVAPDPLEEVAPMTATQAPTMAPVSPRVVQDIRVGVTPLTGPAEEMQSFTIIDWRRLGAQTAAAETAFLAKFNGWRGESFLLYMDAVNAWQQSPLLQQYLQIAIRAVNEKRQVAEVINEVGTMTTEEWLAINAANREIML